MSKLKEKYEQRNRGEEADVPEEKIVEMMKWVIEECSDLVDMYKAGDENALRALCAITYARLPYRSDTSKFMELMRNNISLTS